MYFIIVLLFLRYFFYTSFQLPITLFPHVWSKVEPKSSIFMVRIFIFWEMKGNTRTLYFHWHNPSGRSMALGSTQRLTEMSTRNISWSVKAAGALGWQPYHPHVPIVLKSGSFNLLEPSGPVQVCTGTALPVPFTFTRTVYGPDVIKIKIHYCLLKPCFLCSDLSAFSLSEVILHWYRE